jgi:hypothetical protein
MEQGDLAAELKTIDGIGWELVNADVDAAAATELAAGGAAWLVEWCWGSHRVPTSVPHGTAPRRDVVDLLPTQAKVSRRRRGGGGSLSTTVEEWRDDRGRPLLRLQEQ